MKSVLSSLLLFVLLSTYGAQADFGIKNQFKDKTQVQYNFTLKKNNCVMQLTFRNSKGNGYKRKKTIDLKTCHRLNQHISRLALNPKLRSLSSQCQQYYWFYWEKKQIKTCSATTINQNGPLIREINRLF